MTSRIAMATVTLWAGLAISATAQDGLAEAASSAVRSRPARARFNPFNTWAQSRFGVNFFGTPRLSGRFRGLADTPFFASSDDPVVLSTSSGGEAILSGGGRPDYRPPVRSPYRPPPRPGW